MIDDVEDVEDDARLSMNVITTPCIMHIIFSVILSVILSVIFGPRKQKTKNASKSSDLFLFTRPRRHLLHAFMLVNSQRVDIRNSTLDTRP